MTMQAGIHVVEPDDKQLLDGVRLAMTMWDESPIYSGMTKDVDRVIGFAYHARANAETFLRVAVDGMGRVCGFLVGGIAPYGFHDSTYAYDRMLYVSADARGMLVAKALIAAFEQWAWDSGASRILLGITTGVHTERTEQLYNALGYATVGVLTMKEVH